MSRSRSSNTSTESEPLNRKLGTVARLRQGVRTASSNGALANMVAEFSKVTDRSNARTITKVCMRSSRDTEFTLKHDTHTQDGFAFLTGLAEQLIKLEGLGGDE